MKQLDLFRKPPPEKLERSIRVKGRNVAATSIKSHREEKANGNLSSLAERTKQLLADGKPRNTWQIANAFGKQAGSLTAPVKKLYENGEIVISHIGKAANSGKDVRFYKLADG